MYERYIKRTIHEARCPKCDVSVQCVEAKSPRERKCTNCDVWVPYVEISYLGPEFGNG